MIHSLIKKLCKTTEIVGTVKGVTRSPEQVCKMCNWLAEAGIINSGKMKLTSENGNTVCRHAGRLSHTLIEKTHPVTGKTVDEQRVGNLMSFWILAIALSKKQTNCLTDRQTNTMCNHIINKQCSL
jgi:hypothetical protein